MNLVGIDVGGTTIKYGVFTKEGKLKTVFSELTKNEGKTLLDQLSRKVRELQNISAIGISVPGQVDVSSGTIVHASGNLPYTNKLRVKNLLEKTFQVPVHVENDVNAAALGEYFFARKKTHAEFLFLTYGTGIGGAIVLDGKIFRGNGGYAGEFGHNVLHSGGRKCSCGFYGCYEAYASTSALVKEAKKMNASFENGREVIAKYRSGDKKLVVIVEQWIDYVALGLRNFVHSFHPPLIVLGGGIMEERSLVSSIQKRVDQIIMPSFRPLTIETARLGNRAGMYGAIVPFFN